ncbi:M48 family metalloprotease [Marinomonas sp. C2222]|uniref:M48 family metalloprotease n=1 Tax=Marinomonas sargassi TaxID=2984494 RepID=A0ABT2YSR1_9GAMM|nr:M48 family metalloprotease [Marinomonas sargassi]MCV2402921.1 M48 family metalloprotease [Marinomonas sargassi]
MRLFSKVTTGILIGLLLSTLSFALTPNLESHQDERSLSNPSYVLGQHWFRKLNGSNALIDYPPAYNYLKETLSTLLPQTGLYNKTVEITFLNSSKSNAFVIPGSHMFIYSDIMETITSEDILLGLLAHEVAHLDLKHHERRSQNSGQETQKTLAFLGAGLVAMLAGADSDTTAALWIGGIANQVDNTLAYSRQHEIEADRQGRQYLIDAGLSPDGMTKLFQAFFKKAIGRPKLEFLSTHPLPNTRLSDSFTGEQSASILEYQKQTEFEFFRATLLAYRAGLEEKPYAYLNQQVKDINANLFAKALFSYLIQSPERALSFLTKLTVQNQFTDYLAALSYSAAGAQDQGLAVTQKQLDLAPNNFIFSMLQAEIGKTRPKALTAEYLYERRLLWRANIQYFQTTRNLAMTLAYQALLDFSQGKSKTARFLLTRAEDNATDKEKSFIDEIKLSFESIQNAEKHEDIEEG